MGDKPNMRAIIKVGEKRWNNIGAGWAKGEKISVSLDQAPVAENGKIKFLLVPNRPKPVEAAKATA
ncbi:TPA: hypothetical protein H1012_02450 [archaeon]|nr:hypothetical protein [Candidatus Naiadarchaeales archaeon SRR2090159.bin1288]